ncbi:MAG: T9SS type A sorting domain-containing protein, partial [Cytophagales bacterium]|nr:T9SS type A sorting domain-containing protein [Cytophaga sp.]
KRVDLDNVSASGHTWSVFPNPAVDEFSIALESSVDDALLVTLSDMTQKEVISFEYALSKGSNVIIIPIASLPAGVYVLQASNSERRFVTKIIVQK